jgi:AcrR family transcriptional regulator
MKRPSEITRDRILKTAVRLFAERGYEATGIRTLAAKAHVNQAAINYHFKSKDGLYREVLRGALTRTRVASEKRRIGRNKSPKETPRVWITTSIPLSASSISLLVNASPRTFSSFGSEKPIAAAERAKARHLVPCLKRLPCRLEPNALAGSNDQYARHAGSPCMDSKNCAGSHRADDVGPRIGRRRCRV